jgi:hypothetical protein
MRVIPKDISDAVFFNYFFSPQEHSIGISFRKKEDSISVLLTCKILRTSSQSIYVNFIQKVEPSADILSGLAQSTTFNQCTQILLSGSWGHGSDRAK